MPSSHENDGAEGGIYYYESGAVHSKDTSDHTRDGPPSSVEYSGDSEESSCGHESSIRTASTSSVQKNFSGTFYSSLFFTQRILKWIGLYSYFREDPII